MIPTKYQEEYGKKLIDFILDEFDLYNVKFKLFRQDIYFQRTVYTNLYDLNISAVVFIPEEEEITLSDKSVLEAFINDCVKRFLEKNPPDPSVTIRHVRWYSRWEGYSFVNGWWIGDDGRYTTLGDNWDWKDTLLQIYNTDKVELNGLGFHIKLRERDNE